MVPVSHSKGGRDAVVLGVAYNIPTIITYNPAPVTQDALQALLSLTTPLKMGERSIENSHMKQQFLNYKGTVVHLVSNKDWLTGVADFGRALYIGDRYTIDNDKSHEITGFLTKDEQLFILTSLAKYTQLGEVVGAELAEAVTKQELKELASLKKKFMKSGGGLSASEEVYLDAAEALILTQGLKQTIQREITELKKLYQQEIEDVGELWQETLTQARITGSQLSEGEILNALARGGVTKAAIVTLPEGLRYIFKRQNAEDSQGLSQAYYLLEQAQEEGQLLVRQTERTFEDELEENSRWYRQQQNIYEDKL